MTDTRKPAPDCQTMTDVRLGVDSIDQELVTLIAERQTFMQAAARIKAKRGAVYDPERVEDIVTKVLVSAKAAGLSAQIAEPVWREMMKQCIAYEFRVWDGESED